MNASAFRRRGFTLVEVMMVVAIAAILAAIAYPSYTEFVRKGWRSEARSALMQQMQQMQQQERHFTQVGRYSPYAGDSGDSGAGGKYTVESGNCDGQGNLDNCVRLTASLKVGFSDSQVGKFWVDSKGAKGCDGALPGRCWQ